jgi:tetratricopeptide (TPR) repeat protein
MIRVFIISFSIVCGFFFTDVLYSQAPTDSSVLKLADQYITAGNYNEALTIYKNILFSDPENFDVQEKKLNVLMLADRQKEASKDIDDLIRMYPQNPGYYYLRAILGLKNEKYVRAIDDFDKSIQLDMPKNFKYKVYLNRGMAHFYLQDFDLAESDFKSVIETDPQIAAAYHGLGMVKYEQREYEDAVSAFQKSLKYDEKNSITHFNMAMSYFRLKEKDNACYHFNRSCALGNRNACKLLMMECAEEIKLPK